LLNATAGSVAAGAGNYEVKGSNSYSKMVARYRQDLLAVHAASSEPTTLPVSAVVSEPSGTFRSERH
jgi:hypothetical protein